MEIPRDYIFEMFKQAVDNKVESLEKKLDYYTEDIRNDISEIKKQMIDFKHVHVVSMKDHDDRLKELEQFKYKIYAYAGAIAVFSGLLSRLIFP